MFYDLGVNPGIYFDDQVPFDGLFEEPTIVETMNATGGKLCYVYE